MLDARGFRERLPVTGVRAGGVLHRGTLSRHRRRLQYFTSRRSLQAARDRFCSSTITSALTVGIASMAARPRPSSTGRWRHEPVGRSVNTLRNWTL